MGFFHHDSNSQQSQDYNQYNQQVNGDHKSSISHELIAGAAAFEAAKAYEKHCQTNGKPQSHQEAKELFAGFAGAFVDREAETKGLDFIDREKAKRQATSQFEEGHFKSWGI